MLRGSPSYRKRLFALHGWLGLNFGLWLFVVCFTGAIASLTQEIEWLTDQAVRIQPQGPIQWQETYETLTQAYPTAKVTAFRAGESSVLETQAWVSYIDFPDGRWGQVRIDPYQARIVRPSQRLLLPSFIRQLHYNAHSELGFYIIGFLALPLLVSGVSGLLFYKNWWRSFFRLRTGHGVRVFWSSAHPLIGVWSLVFAIIIAITGLWYLAEDFLPNDVVYSSPKLSAEQLAAYGPTPQMLPLDEYVSAALSAFPGLPPTRVSLPRSPDGTVSVWFRTGDWLTRDRADAVYLHPYSGEVLAVHRHDERGVLYWWIHAADSLHFGYWGGLAGKVVWFLFGLSLPALMLSGAYLSFRRSDLIGGRRPGDPAGRRPGWKQVPLRTVLTLGLLAAMIWTTTYACEENRSVNASQFVTLGSVAVGPWTASVSRAAPVDPGEITDYRFRVEAGKGRAANFKHATLRLTDSSPTTEPVMAKGPAQAMRAAVPMPELLGDQVTLALEIETWDGIRHRAEFSDAWREAQRMVSSGDQAQPGQQPLPNPPPLSNTFLAVLAFFWVVTLAVGAVWLWIDRRLEA